MMFKHCDKFKNVINFIKFKMIDVLFSSHSYDMCWSAGWFSVVTERGQVKARCYNSIHRLVSAQVTAFLSMSDVIAYTHNNRTSSGMNICF